MLCCVCTPKVRKTEHSTPLLRTPLLPAKRGSRATPRFSAETSGPESKHTETALRNAAGQGPGSRRAPRGAGTASHRELWWKRPMPSANGAQGAGAAPCRETGRGAAPGPSSSPGGVLDRGGQGLDAGPGPKRRPQVAALSPGRQAQTPPPSPGPGSGVPDPGPGPRERAGGGEGRARPAARPRARGAAGGRMAPAFQTPATLCLPPPRPAAANGGGGGCPSHQWGRGGRGRGGFKTPRGGAPGSRGGWGGPGVTNPNGCGRAPRARPLFYSLTFSGRGE